MPYTMDDLKKEITLENLDKLTPEERLRGMTPAQIEAYLRRLRKTSPASRKIAGSGPVQAVFPGPAKRQTRRRHQGCVVTVITSE